MTEVTLQPSQKTAPAQPEDGLEAMKATMDKFLSAGSVEAVYGKPVVNGDTLIIPAAEVLSGAGFGMGYGSGGSEGSDEQSPQTGSGAGGGGGGRVFSRPVAVVIASPDGVRIEPVVDVTKIVLALFTALGFMVGMAARMRSGKLSED